MTTILRAEPAGFDPSKPNHLHLFFKALSTRPKLDDAWCIYQLPEATGSEFQVQLFQSMYSSLVRAMVSERVNELAIASQGFKWASFDIDTSQEAVANYYRTSGSNGPAKRLNEASIKSWYDTVLLPLLAHKASVSTGKPQEQLLASPEFQYAMASSYLVAAKKLSAPVIALNERDTTKLMSVVADLQSEDWVTETALARLVKHQENLAKFSLASGEYGL